MNNAERTRRQLMIRFIQEFFSGDLGENIDRIPVEMRPRTEEPVRCCVYKDRAMLKYRLMALMAQDKKVRRGKLTFILLEAIGRAVIAPDLEPAPVRDFLQAKLAG